MSSEIRRRGFILVLSSPSGAGKTTLTRRLLESDPSLTLSVSVTTRQQRPNEIDGVHYHFIDRARFDQMVADDALLESATVFGKSYGTPRAPIEAVLSHGQEIIGDIDWQGTQQMRDRIREDLVTVFILPPSVTELRHRLETRNQDSAEIVAERMSKAFDEITHWSEYDYVLVNRDIDESVATLLAILGAERSKRSRQVGLADFVRGISGR